MLASRGLGRVARAPFSKWHWIALRNAFRVYERPLEALVRYVFGWGSYPYTCALRTPLGRARATLYSPDDMQTVNEVFCREDYAAPSDARVVVDVGSYIGISALYFLTRNPSLRCYLYEPDPRNVERLRGNLHPYEERYVLHEHAVADADGEADFGVEPTGRYGGIRVDTGQTIRVRVREINDVLVDVLDAEGRVDVLKIDIEGLETATVAAIRADVAERVRLIVFEAPPSAEPLHAELFEAGRRGFCERLTRRAPAGPDAPASVGGRGVR